MSDSVTRRDVLKLGLAAGAAVAGWPAAARAADADVPAPHNRHGRIRIAHLTDFHIQPERRAFEGVTACLRHMMAQQEKPELVLAGGDLVMDSFEADEARTRTQWDLFTRVLKDECPLTIHYCVGNHDIWGWNKSKSKTSGDEARWGKKWFCELTGQEQPYHAFEHAGWKFVVLDSVQPQGDGYIGRIDAAQFEWLRETLERTPKSTNVLILTHIPIFSVTAFASGAKCSDKDGVRVDASSMIVNFQQLFDLFRKHPNVRTCLSGHIHMVDRIDYAGIAHLCGGAVCGPWWMGREAYRKQLDERAKPGDVPRPDRALEGYNLINLFDDGSVERQYVTYDWKAADA